jgi:hypothetical protein
MFIRLASAVFCFDSKVEEEKKFDDRLRDFFPRSKKRREKTD